MATNIPPHNLREVIDAVICVLDNENATLDDLMEHIRICRRVRMRGCIWLSTRASRITPKVTCIWVWLNSR